MLVLVPPISRVNLKTTDKWGYTLNWWTDTDYFRYQYTLISAYYGRKRSQKFREEIKFPPSFTLFADSGGYQTYTIDARLTPLSVLRWQEANADIAFTLDVPALMKKILTPGKKWEWEQEPVSDREFNKRAMESVQNTAITIEKLRRSDLSLYSIIQGRNFRELEFWTKLLKEKVDINALKGIAISTPQTKVSDILKGIIFTNHFFPKHNIHFLGLSGLKTITLLAMMSNSHGGMVSFDSTGYRAGSTFRKYLYSPFGSCLHFGQDISKELRRKVNDLPCPSSCPICKVNTVEDMKGEGSGEESVSGSLLALHNLYTLIHYTRFYEILSQDLKELKSFIGGRWGDVRSTIDMFNLYLEKGYDYVRKREGMIEAKMDVRQKGLCDYES